LFENAVFGWKAFWPPRKNPHNCPFAKPVKTKNP